MTAPNAEVEFLLPPDNPARAATAGRHSGPARQSYDRATWPWWRRLAQLSLIASAVLVVATAPMARVHFELAQRRYSFDGFGRWHWVSRPDPIFALTGRAPLTPIVINLAAMVLLAAVEIRALAARRVTRWHAVALVVLAAAATAGALKQVRTYSGLQPMTWQPGFWLFAFACAVMLLSVAALALVAPWTSWRGRTRNRAGAAGARHRLHPPVSSSDDPLKP